MKKRILFLSDIDSAHTRKWAVSLADRGYDIGIFSLRKSESHWFDAYPNITAYHSDGFGKSKFSAGSRSKLAYLKLIPSVKKAIAEFAPSIVHAHYATSYGLLGARAGFHPLVISVWGSDIFDFPKESWLHKRMVMYNLKRADRIFSTSHVMKTEILKYVSREIAVTPFGVDVQSFAHFVPDNEEKIHGARVIGTIKSLEDKYGIDVLIEAFSMVKMKYSQPLKLVIAGSGTQAEKYKELAKNLNVSDDVLFAGQLKSEDVPAWHNRFDIFANLSVLDSESFGVAVVEAMACERPVVVTRVGGLTEVVEENVTGLVVAPRDAKSAAEAFLKLLEDLDLSNQMGKAGRARVLAKYDWQKNLDDIEKLYASISAE